MKTPILFFASLLFLFHGTAAQSLGLVNYAANNPRWLRLLPVINLHM